jgi:hypothetical protein
MVSPTKSSNRLLNVSSFGLWCASGSTCASPSRPACVSTGGFVTLTTLGFSSGSYVSPELARRQLLAAVAGLLELPPIGARIPSLVDGVLARWLYPLTGPPVSAGSPGCVLQRPLRADSSVAAFRVVVSIAGMVLRSSVTTMTSPTNNSSFFMNLCPFPLLRASPFCEHVSIWASQGQFVHTTSPTPLSTQVSRRGCSAKFAS